MCSPNSNPDVAAGQSEPIVGERRLAAVHYHGVKLPLVRDQQRQARSSDAVCWEACGRLIVALVRELAAGMYVTHRRHDAERPVTLSRWPEVTIDGSGSFGHASATSRD
jgi:hypothetical protein